MKSEREISKKTSEPFKELYAKLNAEQKEAVDTVEGPVMVIAGPGTGKTTILTLRIANILLQTDTQPENILALTFTESGVHAMRKKLFAIIGSAAYKVQIYTFHGFCSDIIQKFPEEFPGIIGSTPALETDQINIIENILDTETFKHLKPYGDPQFYVYHIVRHIRELKREGFTPEKYKEFLKEKEKEFKDLPDVYHEKGKYKGQMKGVYQQLEKRMERDGELLRVYEKYQELLREQHLIDFEDMILEVVNVLEKNKDFLLILQEEYQYLLADEHQDTNNAQNTILELLSNFHENPNIFIVGDEKQAIFRFQGASLQNFLYFKEKYPSTKLISLTNNYRSTQNILDNAHELIIHNSESAKLATKLIGASSTGSAGKNVPSKESTPIEPPPIEIHSFLDTTSELSFVVKEIEAKLKNKVEASKIAVIYRNNKDADEITRGLSLRGIPFCVYSDQHLFSYPDASRFITLLSAIAHPRDEALMARALLTSFSKLDQLEVYGLIDEARKQKIPLVNILRRSTQPEIKNFIRNFSDWTKEAFNKDLLTFIEEVLYGSGYVNTVLTSGTLEERMAVLETFFAQVKDFANTKDASLENFLKHVQMINDFGIRVPIKRQSGREGVQLMTAHRAKGLEFDYVFIVHVNDKKWGGNISRSYFTSPLPEDDDTDSDERRLLFVAITRARKEVVISYPKSRPDGKENLPSRFIDELSKDLCKFTEHTEKVSSFGASEHFDLEKSESNSNKKTTGEKPHISKAEKDYLRLRFLNQNLSVTALNNYLECPWKYFYNNLLRLPKAYSKQQFYGIAAHSTLREIGENIKKGKVIKEKDVALIFEKQLAKQHLEASMHKELLVKGADSLSGYFKYDKDSFKIDSLYEYSIHLKMLLMLDGKENEITLTGNLDKIDIVDDKAIVTDFKTAKPKSRNELLGQTKSADLSYFRQIVFYKLLIEENDHRPMRMTEGKIVFVEPDPKGKYKQEVFEVNEDDVKKLKEEILRVADEIYNLKFWDKYCDVPECEHCVLGKQTLNS